MKLRPYQKNAVNQIQSHNRGVVIIPTSGGKTLIMMEDVNMRLTQSKKLMTIVIVAPVIILATQLASQFNSYLTGKHQFFVTHVHSGENGTTDSEKILAYNKLVHSMNKHSLIFTTYRSLPRILESGIDIDVALFDEAHHSTKESNFVGVAETSQVSKNTFFYTATPKLTDTSTSMCNSDVYGGTIVSIPANKLVREGYILPPKILTYQTDLTRTKENAHMVDAENVLSFLSNTELEFPKVLVAAPSTQIILDMMVETDLISQLQARGYTILHITSKFGPVINDEKVSREQFFTRLSLLGNTLTAKFIVFHISILGEGIDVPGFNSALLLRNLPFIELIQTVGRIIRMNKDDYTDIQNGLISAGDFDNYRKPCGIISVPVSGTHGTIVAKKLQQVVNTVFVEGKILTV